MTTYYQGARPGILTALQGFMTGGNDAYTKETERLAKADVYRNQAFADAASGRKSDAEATSKELLNTQAGKMLLEIAGRAARGELPQGVGGDTAGFGLLNTTSADHAMAHYWTQQDSPPEIDPFRHKSVTGVLFLDGHAADVKFERVFDRSQSVDCFNPETAR